MITDSRCRVWGTCSKSLAEDICAKLNVPTKQVHFCPRETFIQVELFDCSELGADRLGEWRKLDIHYRDGVFVFDRLLIQSAPVEFSMYGALYNLEINVAARFVPFTRRH